jgi:hypothetical protein
MTLTLTERGNHPHHEQAVMALWSCIEFCEDWLEDPSAHQDLPPRHPDDVRLPCQSREYAEDVLGTLRLACAALETRAWGLEPLRATWRREVLPLLRGLTPGATAAPAGSPV